MNGQLVRFSSHAKVLVASSQDEAESRGHRDVTTEHLLVAFLKDPGRSGGLFRYYGMTYHQVSGEIAWHRLAVFEAGQQKVPPRQHHTFRRVLQDAERIRQERGDLCVGREHLVYAMLANPSANGSVVVSRYVRPSELMVQLQPYLNMYQPSPLAAH